MTTTSRPTPAPIPSLSRADTNVLAAILSFHCMTATQVTKLLFSPASLTWVQTKLKRLHDAAYLERDRIPTRPTEGSAPLYYAMARKGLHHLAGQGVAVPERARPYRVHEFSYLFLSHLLAVNEVLIAARLLCKQDARVRLPRLLHDLDLKRDPVYLADAETGKRRAVVPDGFLDFEVHSERPYRAPLCLELDRGTETQKDVRAKVRALVAFGRGPYQQAFGRRSLTICFIASPGEARLLKLLEWTEAELRELRVSPEEADSFRLAAFPLDWHVPDAAKPTPHQLFLEPHWRRPFDPTSVALLAGL